MPSPTPVPWGGRLVFSSRGLDASGEGVAFHLYTLDLADGTRTQLTFGDNYDAYPSWSPDGERIVFVSSRRGDNGGSDLFVIAADGSGLVQLTDTPESKTTPAWSPDGAYIAYSTLSLAEGPRLHLFSVADHTSQQLTHGPYGDSFPDWSPDGRYLAFARMGEGGWSTYLWVVETGSFVRLEFPGEAIGFQYDYPHWLPREGNLLSVIRTHRCGYDCGYRQQIEVFEVEEHAGEIVLHQTPAAIETNFAHYTWGPGGEWLIAPVQTWTAETETSNLFRVRVSLTKESRACWQCAGLLDEEFLTAGEYDDYPDWTP